MLVSPQRAFLNDVLLPQFSSTKGLVYDIGKSKTWDYSSYFKDAEYVTVDRSLENDPCLMHDMEKAPLQPADFILFNGVFEQCNDPWALMRNLEKSIKPGGTLLAGIASIGMPPYGERDKWRVTKDGLLAYLKNWDIITIHTFPEYFYAVAKFRS
jgi:hypothetical protein